jgi:DNA adenine methylase
MIAESVSFAADLRSPYPWFGGKSAVAPQIWRRFGSVRNFVEPFFGSGAVLLGRPQPFEGTETVNDLNGWLCNFWRALRADPDAVAHYADWPVSELDLHARGDWLFYRNGVAEWCERLRSDPDFYDAKSAGWWVWGQCCWIGTGWGPEMREQGVNRKRPHLGDAGQGVEPQTSRGKALRNYLHGLAERVSNVRVCCGDWSRVCGPTPTVKQGLTAVFLDPPYAVEDRADCYDANEDRIVSMAVRAWCLEWQDDPRMRIALCGYEGEHDLPGWNCVAWKARGGYGSQAKNGNDNCRRERIWFSPHCVPVTQHRQRELLEVAS